MWRSVCGSEPRWDYTGQTGRAHGADAAAPLVDDFHRAAVGAKIVQVKDAFGVGHGAAQEG